MRVRILFFILSFMLFGVVASQAQSAESPAFAGQTLSDAPELAERGPFAVGVRTLSFTNAGLPAVPAIRSRPDATVDRELTVEIWYPAGNGDPDAVYTAENGELFATRSVRDAAPVQPGTPFPLIVISHGLNGTRAQMAYLADHLASYGYVVAAIDHDDPAIALASLPAATYYRPVDIRFVMDELARLAGDGDSFLFDIVDTETVGLIGYSYGGYGVLVAGGAGIAPQVASNPVLSPEGILQQHVESAVTPDPRVKAIFTFAPFGGDLGIISGALESMWTPDALANITAPLFVLAGDDDEVSGYATGIVPVYENAARSDRYLLTVPQAGHLIAQAIPPVQPNKPAPPRLNNAAQHFATAFFGYYVGGMEAYADYLDLNPTGRDWAGWPDAMVTDFAFRHDLPQS